MSENLTKIPYSHPADQHFEWLADYLRHLVDVHGVDETPELWRSGRDQFDQIHAALHDTER
jgi:hypothetical protein